MQNFDEYFSFELVFKIRIVYINISIFCIVKGKSKWFKEWLKESGTAFYWNYIQWFIIE